MSAPVQMTLVILEPPQTVDTTVLATRQSSAEVRRTAPSSLQSMEQEGETTVICQRTKLSKSPVFLDPRSPRTAPGPPGPPGGSASQARTVCTPGPGPVTTPPLSWAGASVRGRRSIKVTRKMSGETVTSLNFRRGQGNICAWGRLQQYCRFSTC